MLPSAVRDTRTGVFIGAIADDYGTLLRRGGAESVGRHTLIAAGAGADGAPSAPASVPPPVVRTVPHRRLFPIR
ncbi:hypothetical protein AB0C86_32630 [Streptomyces lavendulae]|uniref:hypothetical protein n=1 Tax=Streptomyces lavendulae TaxID=1914 RepID=UPI0033E3E944